MAVMRNRSTGIRRWSVVTRVGRAPATISAITGACAGAVYCKARFASRKASLCAAAFLVLIVSCEIGNVVRREAAPDLALQARQATIYILPVVDRTGTIRESAFQDAFLKRLREFRPAIRFARAANPASTLRDYARSLAAAFDGSPAASRSGALEALSRTPEFSPENRPSVLREQYFAVTIVRENSMRRESRTEFAGSNSGSDPSNGDGAFTEDPWREVDTNIARVFRADFLVFAPEQAPPIFFARYERESEESEDSGDYDEDASAGQICVDAVGQCVFDSILQIVTAGRADSRYEDDIDRFQKAVALELPEN